MQVPLFHSVGAPEMATSTSDYQYTGFTSLNEPTSNQAVCRKAQDQHDSNTERTQSLDAKLDKAMALYNESYSITKNQDWRPQTSTPQHTRKYPDPSQLNCDGNPAICGQDAITAALQMPVPVSDPVPSTSLLRIAAEEAGQQSEALRTRVSEAYPKYCGSCFQ